MTRYTIEADSWPNDWYFFLFLSTYALKEGRGTESNPHVSTTSALALRRITSWLPGITLFFMTRNGYLIHVHDPDLYT